MSKKQARRIVVSNEPATGDDTSNRDERASKLGYYSQFYAAHRYSCSPRREPAPGEQKRVDALWDKMDRWRLDHDQNEHDQAIDVDKLRGLDAQMKQLFENA